MLLLVIAKLNADPLATLQNATPMNLTGDDVRERRGDGREFAVTVPHVGRTPRCVTRSRKSDLTDSAATTGAEILHADDVLIGEPLARRPLEGAGLMQLPYVRLDRDLNGRDAL